MLGEVVLGQVPGASPDREGAPLLIARATRCRATIRCTSWCVWFPACRACAPAKLFGRVHRALAAAKERFGMRIIHYSVQDNHLHLLVEIEHPDSRIRGDCRLRGDEAAAKRALTKAMQGLGVRLARRLNKVLGRRGRLIEERYHVTRLTTPRQVKNALLYILNNGHKHRAERGLLCEADWLDPCATGVYFEHWGEHVSRITAWQSWVRQLDETLGPKAGPRSIVAPRSWLLMTGWHKHGPLPLGAIPGQGSRAGKNWSRR